MAAVSVLYRHSIDRKWVKRSTVARTVFKVATPKANPVSPVSCCNGSETQQAAELKEEFLASIEFSAGKALLFDLDSYWSSVAFVKDGDLVVTTKHKQGSAQVGAPNPMGQSTGTASDPPAQLPISLKGILSLLSLLSRTCYAISAMAASVTPLQPVKLPAGPSPVTPEQQYWRTFRSQQQIPSPSSYPVTHVSFPSHQKSANNAASQNDLFAVTTGLRVQLFSIRTRKLVKTITRFDETAHSGEIRRDGRVMLAGDDKGLMQVFDVNSRAILRTWKEHKQPVWTTKFSPTELTTLMSASDDMTVKLWDLPSQNSVTTFVGHGDYVRTGAFMPGQSANLLVSGSYDETVRIWDPRSPGKSVMTFKHAAPVESVLPLPSGSTVIASAGNQISVLDLVAGKPLQLLKNHQKTVSSLCLGSNGSRVLSGGLDGHVKIFETTGWNVVAGSKYPSPILSLSVIPSGPSQEDRHLVVGLQSGILSVRTRLSGQQKVRERERQKEMKALIEGTLDQHDKKVAKTKPRGREKRLRGKDFMGEGADVIIEGDDKRKHKKLDKWELNLRKGRYAAALDEVLDGSHDSLTVLTLLMALRHRSATRAALQGRDEVTLQPILKWLSKHVADPRYVRISVDVGTLLLDLYSVHAGQSPDIDRLIKMFHGRVRKEVERAQQACRTGGMLGMLMAEGDEPDSGFP
ncbi:MAG: hypothetical protein M1837_000117 [Sclerophora amabilis]|nr:MAG: hypothetical protein M1837_000117 [Sclerophora amabilis]